MNKEDHAIKIPSFTITSCSEPIDFETGIKLTRENFGRRAKRGLREILGTKLVCNVRGNTPDLSKMIIDYAMSPLKKHLPTL